MVSPSNPAYQPVMSTAPTKACPDCGAANRPHAKACRQCGTPLVKDWQKNPRLQRKILRRTDFISAARANQRATRRLVAALLFILVVLGYLGGWSVQMAAGAVPEGVETAWFPSQWGVLAALVLFAVGAVWTLVTFRSGDRIILRLTGAREIPAQEEPQLHNVVQEMAIAAGISKPRVFLIETETLNAFATGMHPARSAIGVTRGLLDRLTRAELQGVIGHEMGHIVNWDIRYATAVGVLVGLIALVSDAALRSLRFSDRSRHSGRGGGGQGSPGASVVLVLVLIAFAALAPVFARLVQMAVSRQREFLADATSVRLTRNPAAMISALDKLAANAMPFKGANQATQHMFIVNPFRHFREKASGLMATHPPLELRIHRLQNLGDEA